MEKQLVVFDLVKEHYGVDIAAVESIIKLQSITAVPHTLSFIEGVTNLRGAVLPVIDLRKRFGLPTREGTRDTRIVVIEIGGETVGMVVDAVTEVLRVPEEHIEPPPSLVATADSTFITGIAKVDERLIILLDLGRVLNPDEKADLQALREALQLEAEPVEMQPEEEEADEAAPVED
jgi:purine-binding chemotaxis protein CheW